MTRLISLLGIVVILIWPPIQTYSMGSTWWVVCTKRVAFSATDKGKIVYCTRCDGPMQLPGSVQIADNCKRFIMLKNADEYARNTCDCD